MSINNRRRTCRAGQSSTVQRNNKLSGNFEQTLRKFSSVEARSRIERNSLPTTPVLGVKITRAVTSRSVSAGVVEIRKAFERVKEELETESNCNYGQFGKRQFGKLQAAPLAIFAPAARLFVPLPATNTSACLRWTRRQQPAIWLRLRFWGRRLRWLLRRSVRHNYGSITSLASSTSLISPQVLHFFLISHRREMFRDTKTTRIVTP